MAVKLESELHPWSFCTTVLEHLQYSDRDSYVLSWNSSSSVLKLLHYGVVASSVVLELQSPVEYWSLSSCRGRCCVPAGPWPPGWVLVSPPIPGDLSCIVYTVQFLPCLVDSSCHVLWTVPVMSCGHFLPCLVDTSCHVLWTVPVMSSGHFLPCLVDTFCHV